MNRDIAFEIPNHVTGMTLVAIANRHVDRAGRMDSEAGTGRAGSVATAADLGPAISAGPSLRVA